MAAPRKPRSTSVDLPVSDQPEREATARLRGKIRGSASVGGGCVWLVVDEEQDSVPLLWPAGWSVRFNPPPSSNRTPSFQVLTERGREAVRPGTRLTLIGWFEQVDAADPCMLEQHQAFRIIDMIYDAVPL